MACKTRNNTEWLKTRKLDLKSPAQASDKNAVKK